MVDYIIYRGNLTMIQKGETLRTGGIQRSMNDIDKLI